MNIHPNYFMESTKTVHRMVYSGMHHFGQLNHFVQSWSELENHFKKQREQGSAPMTQDDIGRHHHRYTSCIRQVAIRSCRML
jgi:hypothetical protein